MVVNKTARSGRLLWIEPEDVLHVVHVHDGRELSHQARSLGIGSPVRALVRFGSSILAVAPGSLAHELSSTFDSAAPVDLAGRSRALSAIPTVDAVTGELHLVADDDPQAYVAVSRGALTRRSHAIVDSPARIVDLAATPTHLVFGAKGFVGLSPRDGAPVSWIAIGTGSFTLVRAEDDGDQVLVHALTPSLERWTLDHARGLIKHDVVQPPSPVVDPAERALWIPAP